MDVPPKSAAAALAAGDAAEDAAAAEEPKPRTPPQHATSPTSAEVLASRSRQARHGLMIALLGALVITPDALLTRRLGELQPNGVVMLFKYLFVTTYTFGIALLFSRAVRPLVASVKSAPRHVALAAALQACVSAFLTLAFLETEAARALLFFSLFPLEAAIFSRAILKEPIPRRTLGALILSVVAVFIVCVPNLRDGSEDSESQASLFGDMCGLAAGASLGALITVNRSAALHRLNASVLLASGMVMASSIGGALCALSALVLLAAQREAPFGTSLNISLEFVGLAALNGGCISAYYISTILATKLVSGTEAALIGLLEMVLGPLWVYFSFDELPSKWTFIGGGLLLVTLAGHALATPASRLSTNSTAGGSSRSTAVASARTAGRTAGCTSSSRWTRRGSCVECVDSEPS